MSEYQYYEFQAIDRPLTKEEMAEVRALSTRATITPTRFESEYHWGNFKGDPIAMVARYYDAFLYTVNWGPHQLMLRLPRSILDPEIASQYCVPEEAFSIHLTQERVILTFHSNEEPEDWAEDQGWLSTLVPLRADIANGDLRSHYLGWLLCVQEEVLDDDMVEPPCPPGLGNLSGSLEALVEFLRIDRDLLQTAVEGSLAMPQSTPSPDETRRWLSSISGPEKDNLLLRLASGDSLPLQAEVRRRVRESGDSAPAKEVTGQGRTVKALLALAHRKCLERKQRETQEQQRQKQKQAARSAYLDSLVGQEDELWRQVETLVGAKRPSEYPQAVRLLVDLQDLAARRQKSEDFQSQLVDLRARNSGKRSFLALLNGAGLRLA